MFAQFEFGDPIFTKATKLCAILVGVFFVLYGGIAAILGVGPAGALGWSTRLLGAGLALAGILFMTPNRILLRLEWILHGVVLAVTASAVVLLVAMMSDRLATPVGYVVYAVVIALSLAASLSLLSYKKGVAQEAGK